MNLARNRLLLASLLGGSVMCSGASGSDAVISYNYVDIGYLNTDIDHVVPGTDVDGDGAGIRFSYAAHPNVHLFAGYSQVNLDYDVDLTMWEAGIGYNTSIAENTDFFATLAYEDVEAESGNLSADDNGYGLGAGLRYMIVNDQIRASVLDGIELKGQLNYVDLDDSGDDTSLNAGILFHFDPVLAVGIEGTWGDDVTTYTAGIRIIY